jgi:hypothetical protein
MASTGHILGLGYVVPRLTAEEADDGSGPIEALL